MTRPILSKSASVPVQDLPAAGDIVGGKYRIESTLGMGGMGAVFSVTHCVTHRRFAIKWLLSQAADTESAVKRFIREAQIAGRVQHPNVVEVYDIYQEPAGIFMVMELLEGESLEARVKREGRLSVHDACSYLISCMEGVAAAHAAGVVHRDLKPANIFLCRGRNGDAIVPKVLDFGISRLASAPGSVELATTRSGTVIGTPHYMAPEQMRSATVDERADVYALGITLYEVLAGVRPYDAASYPDLVVKIAGGHATPIEKHRPELPAGLPAIVARAMHPDPNARFPSVIAFIEALRPYEDARSSSPLRAVQQPARELAPQTVPADARRRLHVSPPILAGTLAALLAAVLAWLTFAGPPEETAQRVLPLQPKMESAPHTIVLPPTTIPLPAPPVQPIAAEEPPVAAEDPEPAPAPADAPPPEPQPKAASTRKARPVKDRPSPAAPPTGTREPEVVKPVPREPAAQPMVRETQGLPADRPVVKLSRDGF